jgi:adenylate kinase family enzyme
MLQRIHITGASGAGTTTLGERLAKKLGCAHFDTDDFYWLPTEPPFRTKRDRRERLQMLSVALNRNDQFVLSGSLDGWGDPLIPLFSAVVFLETPTNVRLARLQRREALRFGERAIEPGGKHHDQHREFLDWATSYDHGGMAGRSRLRHEAWLAQLCCPVIIARGDQPLEQLLGEIAAKIAR